MCNYIYPPPWSSFWDDITHEVRARFHPGLRETDGFENCGTCTHKEIYYIALEAPHELVTEGKGAKIIGCLLNEKANRTKASKGRKKSKSRQCYYLPSKEIMELINNRLNEVNNENS